MVQKLRRSKKRIIQKNLKTYMSKKNWTTKLYLTGMEMMTIPLVFLKSDDEEEITTYLKITRNDTFELIEENTQNDVNIFRFKKKSK